MTGVSFDSFVGIDWSGARDVTRGIQVAEFHHAHHSPKIIPRKWRRTDVLEYILSIKARTVVGIDFAFSVPWPSAGAWPDKGGSITNVRELWAGIARLCIDEQDLFAGPIWLSHQSPFRQFIRHYPTKHKGVFYDRNLLRKSEQLATRRPISIYHMVGPQVGQGSFAGMRLLHALSEASSEIAVWPFCSFDKAKVVIVEVYPSLFYLQAAQRRPRKKDSDMIFFSNVERTLAHFGINNGHRECERSVDKADALVTAAALSDLARRSESFFVPDCYESIVAREGWIFGVPFGITLP